MSGEIWRTPSAELNWKPLTKEDGPRLARAIEQALGDFFERRVKEAKTEKLGNSSLHDLYHFANTADEDLIEHARSLAEQWFTLRQAIRGELYHQLLSHTDHVLYVVTELDQKVLSPHTLLNMADFDTTQASMHLLLHMGLLPKEKRNSLPPNEFKDHLVGASVYFETLFESEEHFHITIHSIITDDYQVELLDSDTI